MSFSKILFAAAAAVFAQHPEAQEVHVTEDGNAWLPARKQLASAHARAAKLPDPVCITRKQMETIDRVKGIVQEVSKAVNNAADRVAKEKEEADANAARIAADEAAAAAQAEEAAAAEAERAAEEKAKADKDKAAADKAPANKGKQKGGGKKGK